MKTVYLAGALFSEAERTFNKKLQQMISDIGFSVFLPQEDAQDAAADRKSESIFNKCLSGLQKSDLIVAVLDGSDTDSGTAWELGYAHAQGKPVIGIRTDFRVQTPEERVNLMLQESLVVLVDNTEDLKIVLENYVH